MKQLNSISFVRFFYRFCVKNYWLTVLYVAFCSTYWALDLQLRNWILKEILDKFDIVNKNSALFEMMPLIYMYFGLTLLRFFVFNFSSYLRMYCMPKIKVSIMRYLIGEVILKSHLLLKKELDILSNQIQEIVRHCEVIFNNLFVYFFGNFTLLVSSYLIFRNNTLLLYCVSSLYILFFVISYVGYIKGVRFNARVTSYDMVLFSRFNDIFANLFNVKLLHTYQHEEKQLAPLYEEYTARSMEKDFWNLTINFSLAVIFATYNCLCLLFLVWQYQSGEVSKAYFPYILSLNKEIIEVLWSVIADFSNFAEAVGKAKKCLERILKDTFLIEAGSKNVQLKSLDIEFKGIFYSYPMSTKNIFEDLSLAIKEGDKVGIVGFSGSGKSTLASLLLNLDSVSGGTITIGGVDIRDMSSEYLHSMISFMNQDLSLLNRSLRENIVYGKLDATDEEVIEAARNANIHDYIMHLADGYDTVLKYQGKELSYGQKQRVLIARAFLKDSPILILDEITSSLDAKSEKMVMESLFRFIKKKTVICIAHKLKTLVDMDYIIVMERGRIKEIGSHRDLLQKKNLYHSLFYS